MSRESPTALVADDDPLLRSGLIRELKQLWPELQVVAEARNGREAIDFFARQSIDIAFLDVQMPGTTGLQAAQAIRSSGNSAHLVFVTAFDQYAIDAFDHGALDYLVKPVDRERLHHCVDRLQSRLAEHQSPALDPAVLLAMSERLQARPQLQWLHAHSGNATHMIAIDDIQYLRSDTKYTRVVWRDADGKQREALLRRRLKDLEAKLPDDRFVRIHRSALVNLRAIDHVRRGDNETAQVFLKSGGEPLPVSRSFVHVFRDP